MGWGSQVSELDTENTYVWNYFGVGVNNKSTCDEKTMFAVSIQNFDLYLNS